MALPQRVRVRLMPEDAGYISSTRVGVREYSMPELMEALVSVAGKNVERLQHLLRTGSVVAGGVRHRWEPLEATAPELLPLLAPFPDPQPQRAFEVTRCVFATIRAGVETLQLPREEAASPSRRGTDNFWDVLMAVAVETGPTYQGYSYRDRADMYAFQPGSDAQRRLREAAGLLRLERLQERIRLLPLEKIVLLVNR